MVDYNKRFKFNDLNTSLNSILKYKHNILAPANKL